MSVFSQSESKLLKSILRNPEENFEKVVSLMENKIQEITTKLESSEEKFRTITEQSLMAIIILQDNRIKYTNRAASDILGYTTGEILNTPQGEFIRYFHSDDVKIVIDQAKKRQAGIDSDFLGYVCRMFKKNGEMIWIQNYSTTIIFEGRNADLISAIDITERRKAEQKLKESEERFKYLVSSNPAVIYTSKITGGFGATFISDNAVKLWGYEPNNLIENSEFWLDHVHPDDQEPVLSILSELNHKDHIIYDYRFKVSNGNYRWMRDEVYLIRDDRGNPKETIGSVIDITDRKITEQKMQYQADLVENVSDAIISSDLNFNIISWNKAAEEIYGWKEEAVLGKKVIDIIPSTYISTDGDAVLKEFREKGFWSGEVIQPHRNSRSINISSSVSSIKDFERNPIGVVAINRDITERKISELKLKESEENFRLMAEQAVVGIFIIQDYKFPYVNNKLAEITGYSVEEMLSWKPNELFKLFHPDDLDFVREQGEKKLRGDSTAMKHYQYRCIRKNGEIVILDQYSKNSQYQGRTAILGIILDISDKMEAEQKLKESEEKYRTLFESSPFGISLLDSNGIVVDANSATELIGYSREYMIGKHFKDLMFVPKKFLPTMANHFKKLITTGSSKPNEIQLIRKDGERVWIFVQSTIVKVENQTYYLIMSQNISDVKKARQELKESEEKYRALFENNPIGVSISDYDGNAIEINEYMKKLLGHELKEIQEIGVGATYANEQDRILFKNRLEDQGNIQDYEVNLKKKDGVVFPALINSNKANLSGKPIYINTIRDITEKKEIEEIKTHLLTRFSHEFKTPLISIMGFSEFLLSEYENTLDAKMIGFLKKIKEGGDRLKLLVNTFIQSSQMGERSTELKKYKENLSDLIKLGVSEMQGLINLRKHTINIDIPEKLIGEFDKGNIYSVITNLLLNAINYTPPEGRIFIHSKIEKEDILFSIKDNGIGLTEEDQKHLFKPFGKIDKYGKGWDIVSTGMGVGLYLSKEIISLHGGKIWAESEGINKGSTFHFSLPIN